MERYGTKTEVWRANFDNRSDAEEYCRTLDMREPE